MPIGASIEVVLILLHHWTYGTFVHCGIRAVIRVQELESHAPILKS